MLNGLTTTTRLRFVPRIVVNRCVFCGLQDGDSHYHWPKCPVLQHIGDSIYGKDGQTTLLRARMLWLTEMHRSELQRVAAFLHVVWRARCVCLRGLEFNDFEYLCAHIRSLILDPWLVGCERMSTKSGRRQQRIASPPAREGYAVYNSDCASRRQPVRTFAGSVVEIYCMLTVPSRHSLRYTLVA